MRNLLADAKRNRLPALAVVVLVMAPSAMAMKGDFSRGHQPDRKRSMPQTREHILLGRQVGMSRVLEERDSRDGLSRQIIYGARSPLWQLLSDGSSQYFHEDPRGNIVALTQGAGSPTGAPGDVLERVTYDPHGKPLFQDPANQDKRDLFGVFLGASEFQNTLLFGGSWYDAASSLRSVGPNDDFGGWYMAAAQYYNPNTGRHTTRAFLEGDPDRPVILGRAAYPEVNPYAASGTAPVNTSGSRGNHELGHALGNREKAGGLATGKRQHLPVRIRQSADTQTDDTVVRKKPGRTTYASSMPEPQTTGSGSIPGIEHEDIGVFAVPGSIPGIEHEDIGVFAVPGSIPGIEHEDIGVFAVPGSIPGIEHEDIGVFESPASIPGIEHEDIGARVAIAATSRPVHTDPIDIHAGPTMTRDSGGYCFDPPWAPPMCCGWSKCSEPGCKMVEVCVYF